MTLLCYCRVYTIDRINAVYYWPHVALILCIPRSLSLSFVLMTPINLTFIPMKVCEADGQECCGGRLPEQSPYCGFGFLYSQYVYSAT